MKNRNRNSAVLLFFMQSLLSILLVGTVHAADNGKSTTNAGSTPNGKPFTFINQQLTDQAAAVADLQAQINAINTQIGVINAEIATIETQVDENTQSIADTQANLAETNVNLASLRAEKDAEIAALQALIDDLQFQSDGLQSQIDTLATTLAIQLLALQDALADNTENISSLAISVTTLNAQILVLNNALATINTRLNSVDGDLSLLQSMVASLDIRLISVESQIHTHGIAASCREILDDDPGATSGIYQIDPDGDGEREAIDAYCDMENFEGGWTNLDFSSNTILLENGHSINCNELSQDSNSITCTAPLFNNDTGPEKKYLYHYRCDGNDASADYLVDHVGAIVGHRNSTLLGFSTQSNRFTGIHGFSDSVNKEYCYVNGEVVDWNALQCAAYNSPGNGNCVPGTFTLTQ